MTKNKIIIGTRKSRLALIQTHHVRDLLLAKWPGIEVEVHHIITKGDKILDVPLAKIGDKGLFTKELENALLDGDADIAVHSYKDLPTKFPAGLAAGAVLERAPNNDALIAAPGTTIENLPNGAKVGTSSLRRRAQLMHVRPDLNIVDLRGNVNTRVDKLLAGEFDAIILARAGVMRMGLEEYIAQIIPFDLMLPAVGQGAIAIEMRVGDSETFELISFLDHRATRLATEAERALLEALEGGCQVPIGAAAEIVDNVLHIRAVVASIDGDKILRAEAAGDPASAADIGKRLAAELIEMGADVVLAEIRRAVDSL